MSAPRSRFLATTDTLRAIFREIASLGGVAGIEKVAVNPVEEDVERGCDRIHAILSDGSLSEAAVVTEPGKVTVERLKGTASFQTFDIALAAALFVSEVRRELAGPVASVAPEVRVLSAPEAVAQRIEQIRNLKQQASTALEPRPSGPKARFRETTLAVGLVRSEAGAIDGVRGFVVNPDPSVLDDGEDRLHALMDDGSISESCLYCGRGSFAVAAGDATSDDLPLPAATQAFIAAVRLEALAPRSGMRVN